MKVCSECGSVSIRESKPCWVPCNDPEDDTMGITEEDVDWEAKSFSFYCPDCENPCCSKEIA